MARRAWLWHAGPVTALGETALVGLCLVGVFALLVGHSRPIVFYNGQFFICGVCGMWTALRARVPGGSSRRQAAWEAAVGACLAGLMLALRLPASATGVDAVWVTAGVGPLGVSVLMLATGLGYLAVRAGVRVWLAWNEMRRRRMLWGLTHAHLSVVLVMALLGAFTISVFSPGAAAGTGEASLAASFVARLVTSVFPAFSVMLILALVGVCVLLPPSALFSFLVARRTTRRLEGLAAAAAAFQRRDYAARVPVSGEDEVAQVQTAFNGMASELQRTLIDLQAQRDQVAQLLEARRALTAGVSHELRTPVATVRAILESTLQREGRTLTASARHDLEVMNCEMLRLENMIEDLFTLARAEAGGLVVQLTPVDVAPLLHRMVHALASLAWRAGRVEVLAEAPADLPPALADAARLEQVLANLLRNALRHTPPGGIVVVAARPQGRDLVIEVRDTGEGIAPADLPLIWERFYRGESERARGDGTGLGLALVKELVEAMGSTVSVESTPGQGTCFSVVLPQAVG